MSEWESESVSHTASHNMSQSVSQTVIMSDSHSISKSDRDTGSHTAVCQSVIISFSES